MLLDHIIMCFLVTILAAPAMIIKIMTVTHTNKPEAFLQIGLWEIFAFSLYFNKDIFLGRSIAKRILGFRVINNKTGQTAGPLRCLVRTVPSSPDGAVHEFHAFTAARIILFPLFLIERLNAKQLS
ncbi:MAG: RDD family protein [Bacteroidetes bacterium]|nr:RDD family protein [Bacteroidota bacterium]